MNGTSSDTQQFLPLLPSSSCQPVCSGISWSSKGACFSSILTTSHRQSLHYIRAAACWLLTWLAAAEAEGWCGMQSFFLRLLLSFSPRLSPFPGRSVGEWSFTRSAEISDQHQQKLTSPSHQQQLWKHISPLINESCDRNILIFWEMFFFLWFRLSYLSRSVC